MNKRWSTVVALMLILGLVGLGLSASEGQAAEVAARALVTQPINESALVTLAGNTRPEANVRNDRGALADDYAMPHLMLLLRRPAERQKAFDAYVESLTDRHSPNYHKWLTAEQIGASYGLAESDLTAVTDWLQAHGLTVNEVYPNRTVIDFSGTAGTVSAAFHTELHQLEVRGKSHFANMSDPQVPAALASAIVGVASLNNFMPHPMYRPRPAYTIGGGTLNGGAEALVPADLATIYNLNPLLTAGISGQGQTIVVIEDTDVFTTADWNTFRSTFGLASAYPSGTFTQVHPNSCVAPGVNGDDIEAILDAEWASAAAPNATIELASCANTATFGGFIAMQNLLNGAKPPPIISISYGQSEPDLGAAGNAFINALYQQAAGEGVAVFVSAGDSAAAGSDDRADIATHGITMSGFATTPFNVAVGGTDFGDTFAGSNGTYWGSTNSADFGSAQSYIPEIPWNDSCASALITSAASFGVPYGASGFCNSSTAADLGLITTAGGSGGPSSCATGTPAQQDVVGGTCAGYPKPSWQTVVGNPNDGVRDTPDVSLFAANGVWGHYYIFCDSDVPNGGAPCTGAPSGWSGAGGTSFAAPIMAAIQALANQQAGGPQGNPNPVYYSLAATEYGAGGDPACNSILGNAVDSSCIFYDVTQGDMDVVCTGSNNCYLPSGTYGVLSTSNSAYQPAYATTLGWDFATGIGTVNATNLVYAFSSSSPPPPPPTGAPLTVKPLTLTIKAKISTKRGPKPKIKKVTLKNIKKTASGKDIAISSITTGTALFSAAQTCVESLAPAKRCKVIVTFTPQAAGTFADTLTINSNASNGPQTVVLTGIAKQTK